jgi:4-hydroxy-tetrahydrodipicolinate synthase
MINLRGTGVALITPMERNGEIDFKGLERVVNHVASGVDYIVALGTTGESATLTTAEKASVLDCIKSVLQGRLPLVLGHGGNDTAKLIRQMDEVNWDGIDAVLSVSPYYNKPSQPGIISHYQAFADACPRPVILYNVPGRTGSNINAQSTLTLAQHPNIAATKEASGNIEQCMAISASKPKDFLLLSGDDLLSPSMIAIGAEGVISVLANAWPKSFSSMVSKCLSADYQASRKFWESWIELNPLLYEEGNPVGIKALLAELGLCQSSLRMPLMEASPNLREKIRQSIPAF